MTFFGKVFCDLQLGDKQVTNWIKWYMLMLFLMNDSCWIMFFFPVRGSKNLKSCFSKGWWYFNRSSWSSVWFPLDREFIPSFTRITRDPDLVPNLGDMVHTCRWMMAQVDFTMTFMSSFESEISRAIWPGVQIWFPDVFSGSPSLSLPCYVYVYQCIHFFY